MSSQLYLKQHLGLSILVWNQFCRGELSIYFEVEPVVVLRLEELILCLDLVEVGFARSIWLAGVALLEGMLLDNGVSVLYVSWEKLVDDWLCDCLALSSRDWELIGVDFVEL